MDYLPDDTVYQNIRTVLVAARQKAYSAVNFAMVEAYWEVGRQIAGLSRYDLFNKLGL